MLPEPSEIDPAELILLKLFLVFLFAKIAGEIFERLKQPSMVGEIIVGIMLGTTAFSFLHLENSETVLETLSELGVIFLLFIIGMETKFSDLRKVGRLAMSVGVLGVIFPFIFGLILILAWKESFTVAMFVGAAMVATSIGITARVLKDMNVMKTMEARIIMGAAVIDDVLGMIVLTIISSLAVADQVSYLDLSIVIIEAVVFILVIMYFGEKIIRILSGDKVILGVRVTDEKADKFAKLQHKEAPLVIALILCLGLSAVATILFRLAAIIGAFLAGMMFADVSKRYRLKDKMEPMNEFLVPFFFVVIGINVDLLVLQNTNLLILIIIVTLFAVAGKVIGGIVGAKSLKKNSQMIIGVGMMPRGEVGIIVASVGLSLGIISNDIFSVIIFMSIITTLLAPPLLQSLYSKKEDE